MLCICARVTSTICSGQPSARAAAAIFSITRSLFFSLLLIVSVRQVDIASNAAFTALRASSESPGADIGLKLRALVSANLSGMVRLLSLIVGTHPGKAWPTKEASICWTHPKRYNATSAQIVADIRQCPDSAARPTRLENSHPLLPSQVWR